MDTLYNFLLNLALILLSTKVLGLITRKVHMPQAAGHFWQICFWDRRA